MGQKSNLTTLQNIKSLESSGAKPKTFLKRICIPGKS